MNSALRRESQGSLNSSASLDLGFLAFVSSKSEVSRPLRDAVFMGSSIHSGQLHFHS